MEPPVRLALAKKIDSVFTAKGWKDSELESAVSASTIQKMRNQNYVPKDRMLGKISDALKRKDVPVEQGELVDLARQQKADLESGQEPTLSSKWEEYLETNAPTKHALTIYLQRYSERYGQIRLLGMSEPMLLKEIYTDVQMVDPTFLRQWKSQEDLEKAFRRGSRRNFLPKNVSRKDGMELANETQFLNVLGQPGAGKSTFLRRIGLEALLPAEERTFNHCCVPVYVELKRSKAQRVSLPEIIRHEFASFGFPTGFSDLALRHGKLLVLLDGLDEVPSDNLDNVIEDIREFVDTNSLNRFITSCRTAFYKTWFTRFTDVVLADFNEEQIKAFLRNWFRSPMDRERKTDEKFWDMLNRPENHATLELAGRPLLLTFICLFHDETLSLPANRSDLYEGAFRILLEKWAAEKRIRNDPICHGLTTKWEILLLEQIAGPAFVENKIFFTENELTDEIDHFLHKDLNAPDVEGRDVMEAIEIQQGLLVKRAQNVYSFSHLTLQEYLAARYFLNTGKTSELIEEHLFQHRWREVFLLIVGIGRADNILLRMADTISKFVERNNKISRLFKWVVKNYQVPQMNVRRAERLIARRAAASILVLALSSNLNFTRDSHCGRVLEFALRLDRGLNLDDAFVNLHSLAFLNRSSVTRDTALDLIKRIKKSCLLKDHLLDELEKRIESLKYNAKHGQYKNIYDKAVIEAKEIKQILVTTFQFLNESSKWTKEDSQALDSVYYGYNLLIDCKEAALSVNEDVWATITNSILA
jgi:hypothetical protein